MFGQLHCKFAMCNADVYTEMHNAVSWFVGMYLTVQLA